MPNQARISPSWKEEVNQRIAAHKNRKPNASPEPDAAGQHHSGNQKAAAAAARVAARFAKAPSYNQALAEEARAAVRAAEAVSRAALEAQAKAESMLAELEAAQKAETQWELHRGADAVSESRFEESSDEPFIEPQVAHYEDSVESAPQSYQVRWESDLRIRQADPAEIHERHGSEPVDNRDNQWHDSGRDWRPNGDEVVEPALPIHANLIEFPREIVATRKVRPRRIEGPYSGFSEQGAQLSIFEVDPAAISTDPAASAMNAVSSEPWTGPDWSGMRLGAQPETEYISQDWKGTQPQPELHAAMDIAEQAPVSLRIMAAVVDFALMLAAFLAAVLMAGHNAKDLPSLRATEIGTVLGLIVVGVLYRAFFYALGNGTPGMKYAGIALCTFDGHEPPRPQRFRRLAALLLSVLPVGVGLLWAIFDDDHLSWHDHLSRTYLRRV